MKRPWSAVETLDSTPDDGDVICQKIVLSIKWRQSLWLKDMWTENMWIDIQPEAGYFYVLI